MTREFAFDGKGEPIMDTPMIRLLCAVVALVFLGVIVLRRRKSAE